MRVVFRRLAATSFFLGALLVQVACAKPISFEFSNDQAKTAVDIIDKLSNRHYRNQILDDDLSAAMLEKYLDNLDPAKVFFLRSDISRFERSYASTLDDSLSRGDLSAGYEIYSVFYKRAQQRLNAAIELLQDPEEHFDFNKEEFLPINEDSLTWAATPTAAEDLWRKRIKLGLLNFKLNGDSLDDAREKMLKRYKNQLGRIEQTNANDAFEVLINALTLLYDPHTSYLSPRTSENFNISMSLSLEGIGAVLQSEDDYTKVVRLIAGGPAHKQGQLQPADRIVAVGQGKKGELVDVIGWRLDDVVKLIRGKKNTLVRLQVIPADAGDDSIRKDIQISRDKVKLEEQAAKKGILELTDGERLFKLGVINVPAFYLDFDAWRRGDRNFKSTTGDVLKLLRELEQENIDGLIVDLRNNGGGSLQEATTLTDLFIDQGPVVQIRQTNETISRHYRSRRPAVYRGPLVVLTNRLSASASEIFAGAIQDYGRGLIVGSQSFGKGTVQSLTPVHRGQLKITESKFYRVSGDSTQHRGVLPDIAFPPLVDKEEVGESAYETALPWDKIHAVAHASYFDFDSMLDTLRHKHAQRTAVDPDFVFLQQQMQAVQERKGIKQVSLNEEERRAEQAKLKLRSLTIENQRRKAKGLETYANVADWEERQEDHDSEPLDTSSRDLDTDDDTYLAEAGYILLDVINSLAKQGPDKVANF